MTREKLLPKSQSLGLSGVLFLAALLIGGCADPVPDSLKERKVILEEPERQPHRDSSDQQLEIRLVDLVMAQGVPEQPLLEAMDYFDQHHNRIINQDYLTVIDFSRVSTEPRKFIIDLNSGEVEALLTAHGVGSDPGHSGYAQRFSNISGSRMSSVGFYLTAEPYYGKYGLSMRLDGLDPRNSRARQRAIVVHGAWYVDPDREPLGRSWGCPAVEMPLVESVVHRLQRGSLMYVWHPDHMALPGAGQIKATLSSLASVLPEGLQLSP